MIKKNQRINKLILELLVVSLFLFSFGQSVVAQETEITQHPIEFINESGEVMAVFIPYSSENPPPFTSTRATTYNIDADVEGNHYGRGTSSLNLSSSSVIQCNITIDPQVSSNIGLYDTSTGEFGFPAGGLSSSGWFGTLSPSYSGTFNIAFRNNSSQTTNYSGWFKV